MATTLTKSYQKIATINLTYDAMSNSSNGKLTIVNSNITNTSSSNVVIYLKDTATAEIKSGTLTSAANVINNASSTSTVILGEKDGNVKENLTLTTESNYTTVWNNGSLYYYDGKYSVQLFGYNNEKNELGADFYMQR